MKTVHFAALVIASTANIRGGIITWQEKCAQIVVSKLFMRRMEVEGVQNVAMSCTFLQTQEKAEEEESVPIVGNTLCLMKSVQTVGPRMASE